MVTRYEILDRNGSDENVAGHPKPDGEWVRWDDYQKLQHAYEVTTLQLERYERPGDVVAVKLPAPRDWEKEVLTLLDALGRRAIRVRPGGGPEDVFLSLATTLGKLAVTPYHEFKAAVERGEFDIR